MRWAPALFLPLALLCAGCDSLGRYGDYELRADERLFCGESFSIAIPENDDFVTDPNRPEDFILYRWKRGDDIVALYEGNFPEPDGIVIKTGRDWPVYVVVHGTEEDARTVRLIRSKPKNCLKPKWQAE